jgi:hypothetical protein
MPSQIHILETPRRNDQQEETQEAPAAGPSGLTDKTKEREEKFDEEGGDQPQAPSEQAVEKELEKIREADSNR